MLKTDILLENLKKGIGFASHGVSQRSQLPILLNFLITAGKNGFFVSATDLEIGIQVKIPAKVISGGKVSIPAKTFLDLINSLNVEKITLEEKEGKLFLTSKNTNANFPTVSADDFPKLYQEAGEKKAVFSKKDFEEATRKVVFAAAQDIGRPALSGVFIERAGNSLNLVATDGFRLSLLKNFAKGKLKKGEDKDLLIPSRVIKELLGAREEAEDISLFVSSKNNQIVFETGDSLVIGRLIEAEYPDYGKIIPQDYETKTLFDRKDALDAVRACLVFARESANIIKMALKAEKVVFQASASSVGENIIEIDARTDGEENEIAFNARYLMDFLGNIDEEDIEFQMTGPLNPGVFKLPKDKNFLHIIMPIRVQE